MSGSPLAATRGFAIFMTAETPAVETSSPPALPLRQQREMLAFWTTLRGNRPLPDRGDFTLLDIPTPLIRNVCLIEFRATDDDRPPSLYVRFAGEAFYDAYGYEMSRKRLEDLAGRPAGAFWNGHWSLFGQLIAPATGHIKVISPNGRISIQHWLRLPLSISGSSPGALLACDCFLSERDHAALASAP